MINLKILKFIIDKLKFYFNFHLSLAIELDYYFGLIYESILTWTDKIDYFLNKKIWWICINFFRKKNGIRLEFK